MVASGTPKFLGKPSAIRAEVAELANDASRMDVAVAFIGRDWSGSLAHVRGPLRVVCWLSSTNTDPRAVDQMRKRRRTQVRQRTSMHAKVYYAPDVGAVVGSANLSRAALDPEDIAGQDEAAVRLTNTASLKAISTWFDLLWKESRRITDADIARATSNWDRMRALERQHGFHTKARSRGSRRSEAARKRRAGLWRLAAEVRDIDLREDIEEHQRTARINPERVERRQLQELANDLTRWIRRRFLAQQGLVQPPLPRVRRGLERLFGATLNDVEDRLASIINSGDLGPLKIASLSVLLHWRAPEVFVPFNWRTHRFLRDFQELERGASNASPAAYRRWLDQAATLSQQLRLASPGHIDRIVWNYTERLAR